MYVGVTVVDAITVPKVVQLVAPAKRRSTVYEVIGDPFGLGAIQVSSMRESVTSVVCNATGRPGGATNAFAEREVILGVFMQKSSRFNVVRTAGSVNHDSILHTIFVKKPMNIENNWCLCFTKQVVCSEMHEYSSHTS